MRSSSSAELATTSMRQNEVSVLCWPTFSSSMVKLPPRSMTMSMTCGRIIESMMWPVSTSRAVCFRVSRGPRELTAKPLSSWGFRSCRHAGGCVDLTPERLGLSGGTLRKDHASAGGDEAGRTIAVPRRLHRAFDIAALRADARNQERQRRRSPDLGDLCGRGRTDHKTNVACGIEPLPELGDVHVDGLAPGLQVLQVGGARVGRPAQDVHAAILVARELLERVHALVGVDSRRVHGQCLENSPRVRGHGVAHVAALAV